MPFRTGLRPRTPQASDADYTPLSTSPTAGARWMRAQVGGSIASASAHLLEGVHTTSCVYPKPGDLPVGVAHQVRAGPQPQDHSDSWDHVLSDSPDASG